MQHLSEENIALYAEAIAEGKQNSIPIDIRNHIKECDKCADEVMEVHQVISESSEKQKDKAHRNRSLMRPVYWLSVAAGITILVGVGGYFIFYKGKPSDTLPIAEESEKHITAPEAKPNPKTYDSTNLVKKQQSQEAQVSSNQINENDKQSGEEKNALAEFFQPNKRLELLAARFDGESTRGVGFELKSPHYLKGPAAEPLIIRWEAGNNQELIFSLFDNRANMVFERSGVKDGVTIEKDIDQGLYYWKLINQDFDLLYCGKIKVE